MLREMVKYLVCPKTGAELTLDAEEMVEGRVKSGTLRPSDGSEVCYPIRDGVPRFVEANSVGDSEARETVEAFSEKWSRIPDYAEEQNTKKHRESWYCERFGFSRGDRDIKAFLGSSKFILEAGTGIGVDTDLLMRNSSGLVFGIDIGDCIDVAHKRFMGNDRVCLIQADLGALPFREGFFDVISCDQVLHHTPDPRKNFGHLVSRLGPLGRVMLYLYKKKPPLREFADDHLRDLIVHAPLEQALQFSQAMAQLGRELTRLNAVVTIDDDIPELEIQAGTYDVQRLIYDHILKCFWNESFDSETNSMVNFDWYRPVFAFRYTPDAVTEWIGQEGLELRHMHVCPSGISTISQKAATG